MIGFRKQDCYTDPPQIHHEGGGACDLHPSLGHPRTPGTNETAILWDSGWLCSLLTYSTTSYKLRFLQQLRWMLLLEWSSEHPFIFYSQFSYAPPSPFSGNRFKNPDLTLNLGLREEAEAWKGSLTLMTCPQPTDQSPGSGNEFIEPDLTYELFSFSQHSPQTKPTHIS